MIIIVFVVCLTDERQLALYPAGSIARDPDHHKSPTSRKQGFEHAQNLSSGIVENLCPSDNHHTTAFSKSCVYLIQN